MEPVVSTQEIAAALDVEMSTVRSWRKRSWRILHPDDPPFPEDVQRGWYKAAEVAAWCKAVGRDYPEEWDKA